MRRAVAVWVLSGLSACARPDPGGAAERAVPAGQEDRTALEAPVTPVPAPIVADARRVELGRALFFDTVLSADRTVACATCHAPPTGVDGNRATALPGREPGPINVPTLLNVGLNRRHSWTGRFDTLEEMTTAAMGAKHAMDTEWTTAADQVAEDPARVAAFAAAYPDGVTDDTVRDAVVQFLRTLVTVDAPFDRYLRGEAGALTAEALSGWELFSEYGCVSCHQGVNVGGNMFQRFGVLEDYFAGRSPTRADLGRENVTGLPEDRHVFRVPPLRNVELTAPYFHDGSAESLEQAIEVMARVQLGRTIRVPEIRKLAAFLRSLTGKSPWP